MYGCMQGSLCGNGSVLSCTATLYAVYFYTSGIPIILLITIKTSLLHYPCINYMCYDMYLLWNASGCHCVWLLLDLLELGWQCYYYSLSTSILQILYTLAMNICYIIIIIIIFMQHNICCLLSSMLRILQQRKSHRSQQYVINSPHPFHQMQFTCTCTCI